MRPWNTLPMRRRITVAVAAVTTLATATVGVSALADDTGGDGRTDRIDLAAATTFVPAEKSAQQSNTVTLVRELAKADAQAQASAKAAALHRQRVAAAKAAAVAKAVKAAKAARAAKLAREAERDRRAAEARAEARREAEQAAERKAAEQRAERKAAERKAAERREAAARSARSAARTPVASGDARSIGKSMAADRGWTGSQWTCLETLWDRESGWRVTADNPSSSAYGIPQALPGSKMSSAGSDWETSASTQIRWGLGYIADRYGSPCGALNAWDSKGWY